MNFILSRNETLKSGEAAGYGFRIKNLLMLAFILADVLYCTTSIPSVRPEKVPEKVTGRPWFNISYWENSDFKSRTRKLSVSSVILHNTGSRSNQEYFRETGKEGYGFHFFVDAKGRTFGSSSPETAVFKLVSKMDEGALHLSYEGTKESVLANKVQMKALSDLLRYIIMEYKLQKDNFDVAGKKGIFTHFQAKKRYGNFTDMDECGIEDVLSALLEKVDGDYFAETEWKDRFNKDWIFRKEKLGKQKPMAPAQPVVRKGRGLTSQENLKLPSLEKNEKGKTPEKFRLVYNFRQKIQPVCTVLHFTAISDYQISQRVLEQRGLSATIMVDKDGKAYQLLDHLDDLAQAATGTNDKCIQIEIVGKNTEELLANEFQTEKVVSLVKEISSLYDIPLNNRRIEEFKGVYSHTQAKKKFGGSVALIGKDFDPGEEYMKKVLEKAGGKFYAEEDWYDRKSEDWIIYYGDFQP
ncbi:MAG TPA: N-acetylmuramoyl-L-alanine amidase [Leptospiraceae bacterium]|nr:N-acetylmuramoyl-L-alanine amidase [Leptospiraceae bacterium]